MTEKRIDMTKGPLVNKNTALGTTVHGKENFLIKIITPEHYKKIPWKNGKGETTELAISEGGTIEKFEWRISMARVVEDGEFSDFTGYVRYLVMISGKGIALEYESSQGDQLETPLSVACFDGGGKTFGRLTSGPIEDFNLICKAGRYEVSLDTYTHRQKIPLLPCTLGFIYCLDGVASLTSQANGREISLPPGHLMQLIYLESDVFQVTGKNMIVIHLTALA